MKEKINRPDLRPTDDYILNMNYRRVIMKYLIGVFLIISIMSCATINESERAVFESEIENIVLKIYNSNDMDNIYVIVNKYPDNSPEWYIVDYLIKIIRVKATNYADLKIVTRDYFREIVEEVKFQSESLSDNESKVNIGEFYNANKIINTSILNNKTDLEIYIDIIDIETGEIVSYIELIPKTNKVINQINEIISLSERIEDEYNKKIEHLQKQFEEKKVELELIYQNNLVELNKAIELEEEKKQKELDALDAEIREKSEILTNYNMQYSSKQKELAVYDQKIERIIERINHQDNIVKNYIINGMTLEEVKDILNIDSYIRNSQVEPEIKSAFFHVPNSVGYLQAGNYLIMFSETNTVSGFYDLINKEGYYRNTR